MQTGIAPASSATGTKALTHISVQADPHTGLLSVAKQLQVSFLLKRLSLFCVPVHADRLLILSQL